MINAILDKSLFKVQCLNNQVAIDPLRKSFRGIFANIKESASLEQIRVYAETGLCLKSSQDIEGFIEKNRERLDEVVDSDAYLALLELILQMFDDLTLAEWNRSNLIRLARGSWHIYRSLVCGSMAKTSM